VRIKDLSEDDVRKISRVIEEQRRRRDLRKEISMNIKRADGIAASAHAPPPWVAGAGQRRGPTRAPRKGPRKGAIAEEENEPKGLGIRD